MQTNVSAEKNNRLLFDFKATVQFWMTRSMMADGITFALKVTKGTTYRIEFHVLCNEKPSAYHFVVYLNADAKRRTRAHTHKLLRNFLHNHWFH